MESVEDDAPPVECGGGGGGGSSGALGGVGGANSSSDARYVWHTRGRPEHLKCYRLLEWRASNAALHPHTGYIFGPPPFRSPGKNICMHLGMRNSYISALGYMRPAHDNRRGPRPAEGEGPLSRPALTANLSTCTALLFTWCATPGHRAV